MKKTCLEAKRLARIARRARKESAFKRLGKLGQNLGGRVSRRIVKIHRYLKFHNLPHSEHTASLAAFL